MRAQALCTEAALNAVQRRYPQIYKSSDRLLIQPESIDVKARDFVIATKRAPTHLSCRPVVKLNHAQV